MLVFGYTTAKTLALAVMPVAVVMPPPCNAQPSSSEKQVQPVKLGSHTNTDRAESNTPVGWVQVSTVTRAVPAGKLLSSQICFFTVPLESSVFAHDGQLAMVFAGKE